MDLIDLESFQCLSGQDYILMFHDCITDLGALKTLRQSKHQMHSQKHTNCILKIPDVDTDRGASEKAREVLPSQLS